MLVFLSICGYILKIIFSIKSMQNYLLSVHVCNVLMDIQMVSIICGVSNPLWTNDKITMIWKLKYNVFVFRFFFFLLMLPHTGGKSLVP